MLLRNITTEYRNNTRENGLADEGAGEAKANQSAAVACWMDRKYISGSMFELNQYRVTGCAEKITESINAAGIIHMQTQMQHLNILAQIGVELSDRNHV